MTLPILADWTATSGGSGPLSSLSMAAAPNILSGNLLVIIIMNDEALNAATFSINAGTYPGWNKLDEIGNSTSACHIAVFYKIAGGSEGAVTVDTATSDEILGFYLRITGHDTTTPIHKNLFGAATTGANSHTALEVTTTIDDCLCLYGLSFDGGEGTPFGTTSSGWSQVDEGTAGTGFNDCSACFGKKDLASLGGSGDVVITCDVIDGAAWMQLAIAPAPGPAIDNLSGVPGGDIVKISNVAIGNIVKMNGVSF